MIAASKPLLAIVAILVSSKISMAGPFGIDSYDFEPENYGCIAMFQTDSIMHYLCQVRDPEIPGVGRRFYAKYGLESGICNIRVSSKVSFPPTLDRSNLIREIDRVAAKVALTYGAYTAINDREAERTVNGIPVWSEEKDKEWWIYQYEWDLTSSPEDGVSRVKLSATTAGGRGLGWSLHYSFQNAENCTPA